MTRSHRIRTILAPAALAFSLLGAAPALAAQRYAAPDSTDTTGACTQLLPCRLDHAVNDASAGDEVIVLPGEYRVSWQLKTTAPISIHGVVGSDAPRLHGAASLGSDVLTLTSGSSASHIDIDSISTDAGGLRLAGASADDIVVRSVNHDAVTLRGTSTSPALLRDSVADSKSDNDVGVVVVSGPASLVNVSAFGRTALQNQGATGVTVRNSILQGASKEIDSNQDGNANGAVTVDVDYSNFRPGSASGYTDGGHNQSAPPVFVSSDDYREAASSPTVDAGSAAIANIGSTDPDGTARIVGSAPDIGAFEYTTTPVDTDDSNGAGGGNPTGTDGTGGNGILSPPVPPRTGKSVQVSEESGTVLVRLPHSSRFVPLDQAASVPMGSIIDASHGVVSLTTVRDSSGTLQTGQFWGGVFRVFQPKSSHPITELRLVDTGLGHCNATSAAHAAAGPHGRNYLWGRDHHGRFRTRGRNAVATVRGTVWKTADSCQGTRVTVKQGAVSVRNLRTRKSVLVHAGSSYLAKR